MRSRLKKEPRPVVPAQGPPALPAAPADVIAALGPLLTAERAERIDSVVDARCGSVMPVLDGVHDPHNIAAVMRSADAFGCARVRVVGAPDQDFFASERIARGTDRWVEVLQHSDVEHCLDGLAAEHYPIYVGAADGQVPVERLAEIPRLALFFGNENSGVSEAVRARADATFAIPMRGFVESLNVSVAAAITLQAATRGRPGDLSEDEKNRLRAQFMLLSVERAEEVVAEHLRRTAPNAK